MLFSTPFFLFVFLPAFFFLYWLLPARRGLLLLGSIVFYAWSEPIFIFVVFASALVDWLLGRWMMAVAPGHGLRKLLVAAGVVSNLGLLVYAKYAAFAVANFNVLLARFPGTVHPLTVPVVALPLGVSHVKAFLQDALAGLPNPQAARIPFHYQTRASYHWGDTLSFRANQHPIDVTAISGFTPMSNDGAYTVGPRATVRMSVPPANQDMVLSIDANAFLVDTRLPNSG
jgi:hypothetical protein